MSEPKKNNQIIFIYKDKLFFCDPNRDESLEFPLANDMVRDLEVMDQVKLAESLKAFIDKSKIDVGEALIILNKNTYFGTTIEDPNLSPADNKKQIDQFSDLVPFDDIFVKQFILNKKLEVVAINREFYEPILSILQKLNFQITMILPELVVQDLIGEDGCTPKENSALLKARNKLSSYSLMGNTRKLLTKKNSADLAPIKKQNKRLTALVATFAFLILILIGALIFNANRARQDQAINSQPTSVDLPNLIDSNNAEATASAETISPQEQLTKPEISSPSAALELDQYTIRVLNGSGISGQVGAVRDDLLEAGFTNIDIGNAQKISSNKTQVLLSPTLPTDVKMLILDVVENIGQEYTIQENNELNYDIVITTAATE